MKEQQKDKLIGRLLDNKYRIVRRVGEGGMGSVYEAEHIRIHRKVAIKVMHEAHTEKPGAVERFIREAEAASAIGHPNIIEIQDIVQEQDGTTALVMELLNGQTLEDILKKKGRLPSARAVSIILQTLSALHFAHQKGILHRDLKPDNVFIAVNARGQEEVKLLDFGIAKFMDENKETGLGLTKTGTVLGTPYYLAPEQAKGGKDIDGRIDIWSAGVMLYETLSGEIPFGGDNYNEILGNILLEEPVGLDSLLPTLPDRLVAVVHKAMAKERGDRFQSVAAMIGALLPFMDPSAGILSEPVARALKESVDPPPYRLQNDKKVLLGDKTELLTQSDMITTNHALPVKAALEKQEGRANRRARYLTAFLVVILLAVAVGLIFYFAEKSEQGKMLVGSTRGGIAQTTGDSNRTRQAGAVAAAPVAIETVTIQLQGLPRDAEVLLDDKAYVPPLELEKSERTKTLHVNAPGYRHFSSELVPDADKVLTIAMKKKRKRSRRPTVSEKKQTSGKTQEKRGEVWTRNPFTD